jgi:hypothetical protein
VRTKKRIFSFLACLFLLIFSSCRGQSAAVLPTSTGTAIPSPTATFTPTAIPTDTPTPAPTQTPVGGAGKLILGVEHQAAVSSANEPGIYLYDLSTQQTTLLFEGFSLVGKASADGSKILLSRPKEGTLSGELYIADVRGSDPVLLHADVLVGYPNAISWLSGTEWIAFLAYVQNMIQVFVIHPDGTELTQVTNSSIGAGELLPAFDGGVYWEEAQLRTNGYRSYGFRWTKLDGSETTELDWDRPAISLDGRKVSYMPLSVVLAMFQGTGTSEFVISNLDGSNPVSVPIEILQLPETYSFTRFEAFSWLPDDKGLLVQVTFVDTGDVSQSRYFIFSADGKLLQELPETFFPETTSSFLNWVYWQKGDWSPNARLYVYPGIKTYEPGKSIQTTPMILDVETMQTERLEIPLEDGFTITKIFWLSGEK